MHQAEGAMSAETPKVRTWELPMLEFTYQLSTVRIGHLPLSVGEHHFPMHPHIYGRLGRPWFLVRATRHFSIDPHILHRQGRSKPPAHEACHFSIVPHIVRHRGWSVCLVHSACCLAIDPHILRLLDRPSCPVRSCSSPGHNFPSCCTQQQENRSLQERRPIDSYSLNTSLLGYVALSAVSR